MCLDLPIAIATGPGPVVQARNWPVHLQNHTMRRLRIAAGKVDVPKGCGFAVEDVHRFLAGLKAADVGYANGGASRSADGDQEKKYSAFPRRIPVSGSARNKQ
jgi:hypothetical protein